MMNLNYPANAQILSFAIIQILNVDIIDPTIINDWLKLNLRSSVDPG